MVEQYLCCYVHYQQSNWVELLPFAELAYNNAVHRSTGLTPFKIATRVEFVPMPEYPQEPPSSVILTECVDSPQSAWCNIKKALAKATESQKQQADKKRPPQEKFHLGDKVYLSTKYLKLRLPCRKLGPK